MGNNSSNTIGDVSVSGLHVDTLGYVVINKYDQATCGAPISAPTTLLRSLSMTQRRQLSDDQYNDDDNLAEYDQSAGCSYGQLIGQCNPYKGTMLGYSYGHDSMSSSDQDGTLLNVYELQFPNLNCTTTTSDDADADAHNDYSNVNVTRIASYPTDCMPLVLVDGAPVYFGSADGEEHMYSAAGTGTGAEAAPTYNYFVQARFVPLYNTAGSSAASSSVSVYDQLFPWSKSPTRAELAADPELVDAINGEETDDVVNTVVGYYMHTTSLDADTCQASFAVFHNSSAAYHAHLAGTAVDHFTSYFWMREDFCHGNYQIQCEEVRPPMVPGVANDPADLSFTLWRTNYDSYNDPTPGQSSGLCRAGREQLPSIPLTAAMARASVCAEQQQQGSGVSSDYMYCTSQNMSAVPEPSSYPTSTPSDTPTAVVVVVPEDSHIPTATPSQAPHTNPDAGTDTDTGGNPPLILLQPSYLVTTQFASVEACAAFVTPNGDDEDKAGASDSTSALLVSGIPIDICVSDHISSSYFYSYPPSMSESSLLSSSVSASATTLSVHKYSFSSVDCSGEPARTELYRTFERLSECLPSTLSVSSGDEIYSSSVTHAHTNKPAVDWNLPHQASVSTFSFTVSTNQTVAPWTNMGHYVPLPPASNPNPTDQPSFNTQSNTILIDGVYQFFYAQADYSSCISRTGEPSGGNGDEKDFSYKYYGSEFTWTPLDTCVAGQVMSCGEYGAVSSYTTTVGTAGGPDTDIVVYSMPVPNTRVQDYTSTTCSAAGSAAGSDEASDKAPHEWWIRAYICRPCPDEHGYCAPSYTEVEADSNKYNNSSNSRRLATLGTVICKDRFKENQQLQAFLSADDDTSTAGSDSSNGVASWRHMTWREIFVRIAGFSTAAQLLLGVVVGLLCTASCLMVCLCRYQCCRSGDKKIALAAAKNLFSIPDKPDIVYNPLPNQNGDDGGDDNDGDGYSDFAPSLSRADEESFYGDDDDDDVDFQMVTMGSSKVLQQQQQQQQSGTVIAVHEDDIL